MALLFFLFFVAGLDFMESEGGEPKTSRLMMMLLQVG